MEQETVENKPTLVVDGDIVIFQLSSVEQDVTDFGDQVMESYDMDNLVRMLDQELLSIAKRTGYALEDIIFAITDDVNFRREKFKDYKSNRKDKKKPLGLIALRKYMLENAEKYNVCMLERLEADDIMGLLGTSPDAEYYSIYSQDKDLFTIPVRQWDFKKGKFIVPTKLESDRFLYTQVLTGDPCDGYKGCPKIGKVKAKRALSDCKDELELLRETYKIYYKAYKEEAKDKLLEQMGQARILHYLDYVNLMTSDKTYDPFIALGVTDEMLEMWQGL